jgi:hypothetical protein
MDAIETGVRHFLFGFTKINLDKVAARFMP